MAYGDAHKVKAIEAIRDDVIVRDMEFKDRTLASGILLADDNYKSEGIRPRWGQIYVVGPKQTRFKPGQWICVSHGRWTRGSKIEIDGGVTSKNARKLIDCGADVLVAGSFVFKSENPTQTISELKKI